VGRVEFEISRGELFCLAAVQGFGSLLNVEYEPEESGADLLALVNKLSEKLREKKWLYEDFDGGMMVTKNMQTAISLCANADRFWLIQSYIKKETFAEYTYTIYDGGNDYLILEQVDTDNYKGLLVNHFDAVKDTVLEKTPFADSKHTHVEIPSDKVETIIAGETYALVSIIKYAIGVEDDERTLVCHDANMYLFIDSGGSYCLSVDESENGALIPIDKPTYDTQIDNILGFKGH